MNHPSDDLEEPFGNSDDDLPCLDPLCDWCEDIFTFGEGDTRLVDGLPLLLCPSCIDSYGECEPCGRKRPGIIHCDETSACGECRTYPDCQLDEEYERAAARARGNDFAATNGRDWT